MKKEDLVEQEEVDNIKNCFECNYQMTCPCCDQDLCFEHGEIIEDPDKICDDYNNVYEIPK